MPTQLLEFVGKERPPADGKTETGDHEKRGKDSADPARVERPEAEATADEILDEDRRYQEAGNHEEHVDADVAAWQVGREGVKRYDGEHRDTAQAIDVCAIAGRRLWRYRMLERG